MNAPNIIEIGNVTSLDEWLEKTKKALQKHGYEMAIYGLTNGADLCYFKDISDDYQILVYFFDYRSFSEDNIGVQLECELIGAGSAIGLNVSGGNIDLEKFEVMAKAFFETMSKF